MAAVIDRFESGITRDPGGCWLWTRSKAANGYGHFQVNGRTVSTHRWAYEHFVGPIPDGLQIDHLCRVRACCNPAHLEPVTAQVNTLRGETITAAHAAKTHCHMGHPFDEANTILVPRGRECRECRRRTWREHARRKRAGVSA